MARAAPPALEEIALQLATAVDGPPDGDAWVYETKLDGYRALAGLDGRDVRLLSRNHVDWTHRFPGIAAALQELGLSRSVIDGELCYVTDRGRTSFTELQRVLPHDHVTAAPEDQANLVYFAFDLLFHDGEDLRGLPLLERKARLRALLPSGAGRRKAPGGALAYSEHATVDGRTALARARRSRLEGLIAKRADAPYEGGRSAAWLKLKCRRRQEFVVAGMVGAGARRAGFRALVLALHEDDGFVYCGTVGAGFDAATIDDLARRLQPLVVERASVRRSPRLRGVTWVLPELVCEAEYAGLGHDGRVRRATFLGLRVDKPATGVVREHVQPVEVVTGAGKRAAGRS